MKVLMGVLVAAVVGVVGLGVWAIVDEVTEPTSGQITELEFQPEQWIITTQCTTVGKTVSCHPVQTYIPECYAVVYIDRDGTEGDDCTTESRFEGLRVGDWYDQDGA